MGTLKSIEGKAPWYIEPKGLVRVMELWGFTKEQFDRFTKEYLPEWTKTYGEPIGDYQKSQFSGDTVVAIIRKIYEETGKMPEPVAEYCRICIKKFKPTTKKNGLDVKGHDLGYGKSDVPSPGRGRVRSLDTL